MTAEEVRTALGLTQLEGAFVRGWGASQLAYPGDSLPPFLAGPFIHEQADLASLPDAVASELEQAARRAAGSEALCRLLWHESRLFTGAITPETDGERRAGRHGRGGGNQGAEVPFLDWELEPSGFPDLTPVVGEDAPLLNLLIALSAVPDTVSFYRMRHLPGGVLHDTLSDLAVWSQYYREHFGYSGLHSGTLSWLRFALRGRLFRLGRLQFMQGSFGGDLTVYRSRRTGEVRALAAAGLTVGSDGLLLLDPETDSASWTTQRWASAEAVYGNPVHPPGRIAPEVVGLPFAEHVPVLHDRAEVLEVHIPEDGPIEPGKCAASFAQAAEFFPRYFPERAFRAFTCESWFLGRELLDLLPGDSNMARFAGELFLYPCAGGEEAALGRIFGPFFATMSQEGWPRATGLQRAAAAHVAEGGRLREGGGFILREDLPWGRRAYQGRI